MSMFVRINVTPASKKEVFEKIKPDTFNIKVREKAERNMANKRVLELVARHFEVPLKHAKMISGHRSPHKIISIE